MKKSSILSKDNSLEIKNVVFEKNGNIVNLNDISPDPDILRLAKEYDHQYQRKKQKEKRRRIVYAVALVLITCVTVTTLSLEPTSALRLKLFRIFSDDTAGSASLLAEDEFDLIGDWEDYWYPTYLPEGFELEAAEKTEFEKVMLFTSESGSELRILEYPLDVVLETDTENTSMEEVKIGYYRGYIFTSDEYNSVIIRWLTDDRQISIEMTNSLDQEELNHIAKSMTYRE